MFDGFRVKGKAFYMQNKALFDKIWKLRQEHPLMSREDFRNFVHDECGAANSNKMMDYIIAVVVGLFAVAYILPPGMQALGGANTTGWPSGTENFIVPIGIFVMIGILIVFAKRGK